MQQVQVLGGQNKCVHNVMPMHTAVYALEEQGTAVQEASQVELYSLSLMMAGSKGWNAR